MTARLWVERVSPVRLWRIFSPTVFGKFAMPETAETSRAQIREMLRDGDGPKNPRLSEVYEAAYEFLSRNQPAEYFYKNALLQRSLLSRHGSRSSRVLFEFRTGGSKLDALVIRESMHAYEIKTELDHFRRLPTQIADYKTRFANVWVLSSGRKIAGLERSVDKSVGLACVSSRHVFSIVREAECDFSRLKSDNILECLRRSEYLSVLRKFGFSEAGMPNTVLFGEAMRFSRTLNPELVHREALLCLLQRNDSVSAGLLGGLPLAVRAAALMSGLKDVDVSCLQGVLRSRVN